jgi:hypothetical protein
MLHAGFLFGEVQDSFYRVTDATYFESSDMTMGKAPNPLVIRWLTMPGVVFLSR